VTCPKDRMVRETSATVICDKRLLTYLLTYLLNIQ